MAQKAQLFNEIYYFHKTCRRLAAAAVASYRGQESPVHPTWEKVRAVLAGRAGVTIARNGYMEVRMLPADRKAQ